MRILRGKIPFFGLETRVGAPGLVSFARPEKLSKTVRTVLAKRPYVLADPVENLGETEFAVIHKAVDKFVPSFGFHLDIKAVASQKDVGGRESNPLVAVEEAVIVAQRLHQRGRFFFQGVVVAGLGTENGGLNRILIANTVQAAEPVDQEVLHLVHL